MSGLSLVGVKGLLISVTPLVGHRLQGVQASVAAARGLSSTGSGVAVHRLSCSEARGIFLAQGLNLCPLHWQMDS